MDRRACDGAGGTCPARAPRRGRARCAARNPRRPSGAAREGWRRGARRPRTRWDRRATNRRRRRRAGGTARTRATAARAAAASTSAATPIVDIAGRACGRAQAPPCLARASVRAKKNLGCPHATLASTLLPPAVPGELPPENGPLHVFGHVIGHVMDDKPVTRFSLILGATFDSSTGDSGFLIGSNVNATSGPPGRPTAVLNAKKNQQGAQSASRSNTHR